MRQISHKRNIYLFVPERNFAASGVAGCRAFFLLSAQSERCQPMPFEGVFLAGKSCYCSPVGMPTKHEAKIHQGDIYGHRC